MNIIAVEERDVQLITYHVRFFYKPPQIFGGWRVFYYCIDSFQSHSFEQRPNYKIGRLVKVKTRSFKKRKGCEFWNFRENHAAMTDQFTHCFNIVNMMKTVLRAKLQIAEMSDYRPFAWEDVKFSGPIIVVHIVFK